MADRSKASENEKRHREVQLDRLLEEENNRQRDIVSDMTRQYKSRFEELSEKEKQLKREIDANSDVIARLTEDYEKLEQEKQTVEKGKQEDIARLKKQIDDMSNEFAQMLKSTLEKMQTRINEANKQWEEENDVNLLKHFESAQLK
jgi:prefoldin subunit 5